MKKKYEIVVSFVGEALDLGKTVDGIREYLTENIPSEVFANVKPGGVSELSEQGFKVWRARVVGVTAEQAGDAHNPKVSKPALKAAPVRVGDEPEEILMETTASE